MTTAKQLWQEFLNIIEKKIFSFNFINMELNRIDTDKQKPHKPTLLGEGGVLISF